MNWNKRLKAAREKAGLTKSEFAKRIGVSAPTVTDWENGEIKKIDGENLLRAASAVGTTAEWLMHGVNSQTHLDAEAAEIAEAFKRITDQAQRDAIITQLRAFGVLHK